MQARCCFHRPMKLYHVITARFLMESINILGNDMNNFPFFPLCQDLMPYVRDCVRMIKMIECKLVELSRLLNKNNQGKGCIQVRFDKRQSLNENPLMPDSVLIPAPVSTTMFSAFLISIFTGFDMFNLHRFFLLCQCFHTSMSKSSLNQKSDEPEISSLLCGVCSPLLYDLKHWGEGIIIS